MNCPRCKTVELEPVISEDGSAWEADKCPQCECSWWFNIPKDASEVKPKFRLDMQ